MKSFTAADYGLAALVLLSLAGKLATNQQDQDPRILERAFASTVVRQLSKAGFTSKIEEWPTGVAVQAQRGACLMWVREDSPHGTMRNVYDELARPVGSLHYIYRGVVYKEPPKLEPLMRFFIHREIARVAIVTSRSPIYAVASSTACNLRSIQW